MYKTSTAKQVLGNCERMVFAGFVENFDFDSFNPKSFFTFADNFYPIYFSKVIVTLRLVSSHNFEEI